MLVGQFNLLGKHDASSEFDAGVLMLWKMMKREGSAFCVWIFVPDVCCRCVGCRCGFGRCVFLVTSCCGGADDVLCEKSK